MVNGTGDGTENTPKTTDLMTRHQALNQVNQISLPERLENVSGHVEKNFLHPKKSRMKSILRIIRIIIT